MSSLICLVKIGDAHNPNDTTWMDDDNMIVEDDVQVKEVSKAKAGRVRGNRTSEWDFDGGVCPKAHTFPMAVKSDRNLFLSDCALRMRSERS